MRDDVHPRKTSVRNAITVQCNLCGKEGLRPLILATVKGNYGVREQYGHIEEMAVDDSGLCKMCQGLVAERQC